MRLKRLSVDELLANYLPYAEAVTAPESSTELPQCRDPKDQMFLLLAHAGNADVLVTGDDDLLQLATPAPSPFTICTPAALLQRLTPSDN